MPDDEIERQIAVIFATDVVGYSKHMEFNEVATVKSLRACEKILLGFFKEHKARLFNTGGDSFLAEFPSALSAVECAVAFQSAVKKLNKTEDSAVALEFRIGINSGDVIKEKSNFLGEGVNIAARLEALAQTGGITISKTIYDYVKGKIDLEFDDLGYQKVKQNEFHAVDIILPGLRCREKEKKPNPNRNYLLFTGLAGLAFSIVLYSVFITSERKTLKIISGTLDPDISREKPENGTTDSIRNHFMQKLSEPKPPKID